MLWNQKALDNLDCWTLGEGGFEPDAVFYNYSDDNREHFLGNDLTWASNFPRKYRDTHKLDSDDERIYTVGAGDSDPLVAGKGYYTLMRATPGNAPVDQFKLVLQATTQMVPFCHSPWCFRIRRSAVPVPYPLPVLETYNVPGSISWVQEDGS